MSSSGHDCLHAVPEAPGLGIEVDEAVCDAHPFKQELIHPRGAVLADGTVVSW
jgi:galactonate dehydratase